MTSRGWGDYGLYVNKYLELSPAGAHMRCSEPMRTDRSDPNSQTASP